MYLHSIKLLVLYLFLATPAAAQSSEELIMQNIQNFFDGMREADSSKMRKCLAPNCSLKSIQKAEQSNAVQVLETDIEQFLRSVTQKREGMVFDERLLDCQIKLDGAMAIAWAPYQFYVNRRLIHCGVNVFTFAFLDNSWKILSITDTRRRNNCQID